MKCKKCGHENADVKRTCENCNSFLEGWSLNSITGRWGYRTDAGKFLLPEQAKEIKQQDFDEAVKRLPSPTEIDFDLYIIPCIKTDSQFVFRKEHFYIIPQGEKLTMWVLKEIIKNL